MDIDTHICACLIPLFLASCGNFHWLLCEIGGHSVPAVVSRIFTESIRCRQTAVLRCLGFLARSEGFARCIARAKNSEWVVYAKRPFAGPEQVLDYVGHYTHRVALSNNRLLDIENGQVRFQWKNYRDSGQTQTMTLSADEFIRRFLLHVLPNGFQRIRYYGFLGNRYRQQKLAQCRRLLGMPMPNPDTVATPERDYRDHYERLTGGSLRQCPQCLRGHMVTVAILPRLERCPCHAPITIDSS